MSAVLSNVGPRRRERYRPPKPGAPLTEKEREILPYLAIGRENSEIGILVGQSPLTVKNHIAKLIRKLGAFNRMSAVWKAMTIGLIKPPTVQQPLPDYPVKEEAIGEKVAAEDHGILLYESGRLFVNGERIHIWPLDFGLLKFFVTHLGRTYTRDQLLDEVWGEDGYIEERTVDVHIRRLRNLLPPDCGYEIETVRNVGYRFVKKGE